MYHFIEVIHLPEQLLYSSIVLTIRHRGDSKQWKENISEESEERDGLIR